MGLSKVKPAAKFDRVADLRRQGCEEGAEELGAKAPG